MRPKQVCSILSHKFVSLHVCGSDSEICFLNAGFF